MPDASAHCHRPAREGLLQPWIIATAQPGAAPPRGVDLVRLDASRLGFGELPALHQAQRGPCLLDLPGPRASRDGAPLTTTEWLVFAATEAYEWVHLRGVREAAQLEHAREFLHESTRISLHIDSVERVGPDLGLLLDQCDGAILDADALREELGARATGEFLRYCFFEGDHHGVPMFLQVGVRPDGSGPTGAASLASAMREGCDGVVLVPHGDELVPMQQWIDGLQQAFDGEQDHRQRRRPAARLGGRPETVAPGELLA